MTGAAGGVGLAERDHDARALFAERRTPPPNGPPRPYRGSAPFRPQCAGWFFAVTGASGVGKSSPLHAGTAAEDRCVVPGAHPFAELTRHIPGLHRAVTSAAHDLAAAVRDRSMAPGPRTAPGARDAITIGAAIATTAEQARDELDGVEREAARALHLRLVPRSAYDPPCPDDDEEGG
ncbi:hypothetical protein ACIQMJ_19100 [Actinosynnema sp. NPDC091369]